MADSSNSITRLSTEPQQYPQSLNNHQDTSSMWNNHEQAPVNHVFQNQRNLPEMFIRSNGISLIIFSVIMILMQVEQITISILYPVVSAKFYEIASGIWCGVYYLITAIIALNIGI